MIITIGSKVKDAKGNTYLLKEEIGQGGFGCVYKAVRESDDAIFAIKTLLYSFSNEEAVDSFKNEIVLSAKINGDNVINYVYAHNGEEYPELPPYIIMEYATGGTLKDMIARRKGEKNPFTKEELIIIYKQLISGMKSINSLLVHRDIKPENILVCGDRLKVSDFGLAKISSEVTRTKTFKGFGSIPYIAPEAWNFDKNTIQMDIYSMGIVFYELAMLEYPYEIKTNDIEVYKNAHMYSPIKDSNTLKKAVGTDIASIILMMLEKPTQRRFKNWAEIEEKFQSDESDASEEMSAIIDFAISKKISKDIEAQRRIEEEEKAKREKDNFCKIVKMQFGDTVIGCIKEIVNHYNEHLSSTDKGILNDNSYRSNELFHYLLNIPSVAKITIKCKVILPNSMKREVESRGIRGYMYGGTQTITFTPQYKKQNIMGWVEITNDKGLGFNLLLTQTDGLYGDWYIMDNKNNFSAFSGKERKEPFAFSVDELYEALRGVECTSLYSSDIITFNQSEFVKRVNKLLV